MVKKYFTHFVILSGLPANYQFGSVANTTREGKAKNKDQLGSMLMPDAVHASAIKFVPALEDNDLGGVAVAHEFCHMVIMPTCAIRPAIMLQPGDGDWGADEHIGGTSSGNQLMFYDGSDRGSSSAATVVFGELTEKEIDLRGNPSLHK